MKYSIWIIPPEPLYTKLKNIIDNLSKDFNGPSFEPHMTILGDIDADLTDIKAKAHTLASTIDKLDLSTGTVSFSTTYFQSVFVRITSTAALMQLNLNAKQLFNMPDSVFMPHISLLYGDHDMVIRENAVKP